MPTSMARAVKASKATSANTKTTRICPFSCDKTFLLIIVSSLKGRCRLFASWAQDSPFDAGFKINVFFTDKGTYKWHGQWKIGLNNLHLDLLSRAKQVIL